MKNPYVEIEVKTRETEDKGIEETFCFGGMEVVMYHNKSDNYRKDWLITPDDAIALGEYLIALGKLGKKKL